jgi:hypothetical protein
MMEEGKETKLMNENLSEGEEPADETMQVGYISHFKGSMATSVGDVG